MDASPGRAPVNGLAHLPFEQAAAVVLGELQHAVADLLSQAPEETKKAADVERIFGIDHRLGWQVYRIAKADNPLAAGPHVPAKVSIEKLLKAAARRRVPRETIGRVAAAFADFERLVETNAGDRTSLEAMLAAFLPEERAKYELAGKQAAFQGISQIKGVVMEAAAFAFFLTPSEQPNRVDTVMLLGEFGLRRVRPGAPIVIGTDLNATRLVKVNIDEPSPGAGIDESARLFLPQFSSSPIPSFDVLSADGLTYYTVASDQVGLTSAVDLVMATRIRASQRRHLETGCKPITGVFHTIDTPTKRATIDVFVHRDLYPGVSPELAIYDTVTRGIVWVYDDPIRRHDRLQLQETVRPLPPGFAPARLPHVPRYAEMLEHVCQRANLNIDDFRAYRLDMHYPFYGAQYMIGFQLPQPPTKP